MSFLKPQTPAQVGERSLHPEGQIAEAYVAPVPSINGQPNPEGRNIASNAQNAVLQSPTVERRMQRISNYGLSQIDFVVPNNEYWKPFCILDKMTLPGVACSTGLIWTLTNSQQGFIPGCTVALAQSNYTLYETWGVGLPPQTNFTFLNHTWFVANNPLLEILLEPGDDIAIKCFTAAGPPPIDWVATLFYTRYFKADEVKT